MRFNEKELKVIARTGVTEKEGKLLYRSPKREGYKGRWFRLKGNLLFYFGADETGGLSPDSEVKGVIVLENSIVQMEQIPDRPYVFSLYFDDSDKKHYFNGASSAQCEEWVRLLKNASYEHLRSRLTLLQAKLVKYTGKDPLFAISLGNSYIPKTYEKEGRRLPPPRKKKTNPLKDMRNLHVSAPPADLIFLGDP